MQPYTHPLWMFGVAGLVALTDEFYFTIVLASLALSALAAWVVAWKISHSTGAGVLAVAMLLSSKAFVDYATSGLENPLSYLLVAIFALIFVRMERTDRTDGMDARTLARLCALASLCAVNRLDTLLLFAPALLSSFLRMKDEASERSWRSPIAASTAGFLPLIVWELFSLVYYGFPFPNTAYAKLGTGIPRVELLEQGVYYLLNSLREDPATLLLIALGVLVGLRRRWIPGLPSSSSSALMSGVVLYLCYVVWIGGDFMSGRFLAAPLLLAVAYLASVEWLPRVALLPAALAVVLLGLAGPNPSLLSGRDYEPRLLPRAGAPAGGPVDQHGISDERAFYYHATGLLTARGDRALPVHRWATQGREASLAQERVVVRQATGFFGFFAGPGVHVVDAFGLSDPLLARRPLKDAAGGWRIGHFERVVPLAYRRTLNEGANRFANAELADYYEKLLLVTRGELFSAARWRAILELNTEAPPTPGGGPGADPCAGSE